MIIFYHFFINNTDSNYFISIIFERKEGIVQNFESSGRKKGGEGSRGQI